MVDLYVILGVDRAATLHDIKRAYRRLARKYHPDINPGDRAAEVYFRRIVEAYETLSDPDRRRRYDTGGGADAGDAPEIEFEGFDFSAVAEGSRAATFSELFADVFQRASVASADPEQGADLHAVVDLGFADAIRGGQRSVTVTRLETCETCGGRGRLRAPEGRCRQCRGSGSLRWARGHMVFSRACSACGGTGSQQHQACPVCAAEGVRPRSETVVVNVPPGIEHGARIRVIGKGHAGRRMGRPGDLYVAANVERHPFFERQGDDLFLVVPVAIHEAALGAKIDVPTLEGPAKLKVPPGTQSGQRFRLRDRGVTSMRDGRRGDLVVEVRLVMPRLSDERSKELLREFGRINNENVRKDLGV